MSLLRATITLLYRVCRRRSQRKQSLQIYKMSNLPEFIHGNRHNKKLLRIEIGDKMAYTIEVTKELFLVTKQYSRPDDRLHIIMSKKEVQEELKKDMGNIEKIEKLVVRPDGKVTKKYFLPKDWEKINKMSVNYHFWKMIAEGED